MDSKDPKDSFQEFLAGEVRYASLKGQFPQEAEELFVVAEANAKDRYAGYKRMEAMQF